MHLAAVREANETYRAKNQQDASPVYVFAGATSGIGASTLSRMADMSSSPTFYVIGRSESRFATQRLLLGKANPSCRVIFLEAEFSLLSHVDRVCKKIADSTHKVDGLYMSPGMIPLNGASYTHEGLETCFAISYYSRMLLTERLLPLLRKSRDPKVMCVLNGGKEAVIGLDNLGLENSWTPLAVVGHSTTMTTLSFEHLAQDNRHITFMHVYPGWVRTDNFARLTAPESASIFWGMALALIRSLAETLAFLFGTSAEECAERQVFHLTDPRYGPGVRRIGHQSEEIAETPVLREYKESSLAESVWDHNKRIFDRVLNG
ncbi:hypothetical protein JX266_000319 [Neoarthrinium moseri]|nr:hypothetical protein JX266_000319 [Neoarthrinium moseri]